MPYRSLTAGRILVVDDRAANLRVVSTLLDRQGHTVVAATNGPEALAAAAAQPPDLFLLDMMMPGMDGFELLAALRAQPALAKIPAIFVTAADDRELLLRAFDAGAVDYVTKPFMPEELLARVGAHLGLKQARDRLERVARERQQLVNLVAHDLKNPLTSVLFASEVLLQGGGNEARLPRYLKMIHDSASDAIGYIRNYLDAQAQAAQAQAVRGCRLQDVLDWLRDRYELQLEALGMKLSVVAPAEPACVAVDALVLRQVAENLVSNAMKYARGGAELELYVRAAAPGFWHLLALDRGPGITPSRRNDLFKPFHRLTTTAIDDNLSSGLGLSLAQQIIANAGGQLWYEDREGGGSCFVIELPAAADTESPAA